MTFYSFLHDATFVFIGVVLVIFMSLVVLPTLCGDPTFFKFRRQMIHKSRCEKKLYNEIMTSPKTVHLLITGSGLRMFHLPDTQTIVIGLFSEEGTIVHLGIWRYAYEDDYRTCVRFVRNMLLFFQSDAGPDDSVAFAVRATLPEFGPVVFTYVYTDNAPQITTALQSVSRILDGYAHVFSNNDSDLRKQVI